MNDRTYDTVLTIGIVLIGLWLYYKSKQNDAALLAAIPADSGGNALTPEQAYYAANPSTFAPQSIGAQTINIENQGLSYLTNQYVPLFGFVGMAQSSNWVQ